MGCLRYFNILHEHKKTLPWILVGAIFLLGVLAPIPSFDIWSKGYFTIYAPFLFLGAFCYLKEIKQVGFGMFIGFTSLVLFQYYYQMSIYQPNWIGEHFATLALLLFFLSWIYRANLIVTTSVLFFSDLTYSVYLMHNWSWDPIKALLEKASISILHPDIQALFVLFLICFTMLKLVEKLGIKLGRTVLKYIREKA